MSSKQRYVIQTNRTGGATFRIPLDKGASVSEAMLVISSRMSSILKVEMRVTNVLVSKMNLFEEDILEDVVDADEMIYVELVDAVTSSSTVGGKKEDSKYIDMSDEQKGPEESKENRSEDKQQLRYVTCHM